MAKRRGHYKMTPARRQALHKAQLASARKRHRRAKFVGALRVTGTVAAAAAGTFAVAQVNRYASNPREAIRDYKDIKGFVNRRRGVDPNAPGKLAVKRVSTNPLSRRSVRHHIGARSLAGRRIRSR